MKGYRPNDSLSERYELVREIIINKQKIQPLYKKHTYLFSTHSTQDTKDNSTQRYDTRLWVLKSGYSNQFKATIQMQYDEKFL